jgi:hypothetical protein
VRGTRALLGGLASGGFAAGLALVVTGAPVSAGDHCAPPALLPAYAHNDYLGDRPLDDALERGYGGVEADVFLLGGALRLGHDRPDADSTRTLEAVYLEPLAGRFAACGFVLTDTLPFLLFIEDKSPTPESRRALADRLEAYRHLFLAPAGPRGESAVEVVLVDEEATAGAVLPGGVGPDAVVSGSAAWEVIPPRLAALVGRQWRATRQTPVPPSEETYRYRLFSLDWRREFDWEGSGRAPAAARKLLEALVAAKALSPGSRIRVHNVPARTALYRFLVESGVDLVGVTDLRKGSEIFAALSR